MTRALQSSSPEYLQASRALLRGRVACHQHLPLLSPGPMGTGSKAEPALALAEAHSPCAVRRGPCRALGSTAHPHRTWPRCHHGLRRRGRQAPWEPTPPRSRPRAAVQGAATCAPPSACHSPPCPRHGPLRVSGAVRHRLLSVQTPSHSVRPTVVLTCVSLTTGGLTVSCRRCSYLRSLGMSACTLFSCGDSMALPSEGCWPLRALEGVPLFHSWQSL